MEKSKGGLSVRASDIVKVLNGDHLTTGGQVYNSTNLIGLALKMDDQTKRDYVDVKFCSVHYIQNTLYAVEVPYDNHDIYSNKNGYSLDTKQASDCENHFFEYDFLMNRHDVKFGFGYVGKKEIEMLTNFLNPEEEDDEKRILILGSKTDFGDQAPEDHYFTFMLATLPHAYQGEIPKDNIAQLLGVPAWLNAIPCPPVWRTEGTANVANATSQSGDSEIPGNSPGGSIGGLDNEENSVANNLDGEGTSVTNSSKEWRNLLKYAIDEPTEISDFINIIEDNLPGGASHKI